jgi:hypothetical protein
MRMTHLKWKCLKKKKKKICDCEVTSYIKTLGIMNQIFIHQKSQDI